jgi:membrane-bound lytic murein transglycosylase A
VQSCDCTQKTLPNQLPGSTKNNAEVKPTTPINTPDYALLKPASWSDINGLVEDDLAPTWPAWLQSCSTLINKPQWQAACNAAKTLNKPDKQTVQAYFTQYFNVYSTTNQDGTDTGLITGYYEPLLKGSRTKSIQYPYPLYKQPADLISVELSEVYPELKNKRVRGKLISDKEGRNKLVPYLTRADIEANPAPLAGNELVWIDDIIDVFFLQVQGSGLVKLDSGEDVHVGYADQNGQTYNSIGRTLVERGELTLDQASMQGIKNWARNNLGKLRDLLNSNPSYVFFRELPAGLPGPLGALGVPITAERSVAIDPKYIPLGAPIFLSTTQPNSTNPLKRLMVAQDTGGAIKGGVRADFFWGAGNEAGKLAGAMKQVGKIWVLLPKDFQFPK